MMQAGASGIIMEVEAFEKASGIWNLSFPRSRDTVHYNGRESRDYRFRCRLVCRADVRKMREFLNVYFSQ